MIIFLAYSATGFYWDEQSLNCIRDKNSSIDHYAIPKKCPPFTTYNRTTGYKKIPGDTCVGGAVGSLVDVLPCPIGLVVHLRGLHYFCTRIIYWVTSYAFREKKEFLLLAQKERIVMFKLSDFSSEIVPIEGLQNVISVEFDYHKNCLFYADIVSDVISVSYLLLRFLHYSIFFLTHYLCRQYNP